MRISPELFQLLSACLKYSRESEGAFDITVGPLMKVWGFYKGTGHLPHRAEVAAALTKVGYRHVHLDPKAQTVRFDQPGVELDPGGIGKGYAVDRMVDVLRKKGIQIALVAGSGSSIYGMGAPPSEPRGWAIDIKNPWNQSKTAGGGVSEERVDVHLRQLREVLPGGRQDLHPHHGPADRVSGAGQRFGFGDFASHHRQRGVGQTVFRERPPVGGEA